MFASFRQDVYDGLHAKLSTPIWDVIPDDVAELPCIVVGRPGGQEGTQQIVVWDLTLPVHVIGRRQQAGGSDVELLELVDDVFVALGGTRGTDNMRSIRLVPEVVVVAGQECSGYVVTVEQPNVTC